MSALGNYLALHDGYQYHQKRNTNGIITWQCSARKKRPHCNGTLVTNGDEIVRRKEHICKQDFLENERKKLEYKWMMQIGPNEISMRSLYGEISKEYEEAGLEIPTHRQVWKLIEKARRRAQGPYYAPQNSSELPIEYVETEFNSS